MEKGPRLLLLYLELRKVMMDGMGMMIWGVFSFLLGLLLILFFVLVVVAAVKWLWGRKLPFVLSDRENALEILKRRYAKGEISKEVFETIRRDIEK
jgi:putative membrane protein